MFKVVINILVAATLILAPCCNLVNFEYTGEDCGTTVEQTDSISFTRENFPSNPAYGTVAEMATVGLRLIASDFCAKDPVSADFLLRLDPATLPVYIAALVLSDEDMLEIPVSWETDDYTDFYSGHLDSVFTKRNPGESFVVMIEMIFQDQGDYIPNIELARKWLIRSEIRATYQKKIQ